MHMYDKDDLGSQFTTNGNLTILTQDIWLTCTVNHVHFIKI